MRNLLSLLLLCAALTGCTFFYTREYLAVGPQDMSAQETEAVFRAFENFLTSKGLSPQRHGENGKPPDPNRVTFQIGGSKAGFALRHDWEDLLELSYTGENEFRLRLMRIVHHPANFADEYLKRFVEQTEGFLREATNKPLQLKLIPPKRT